MRISDWSSDVYSSDLIASEGDGVDGVRIQGQRRALLQHHPVALDRGHEPVRRGRKRGRKSLLRGNAERFGRQHRDRRRSEERRGGKEGVRTCSTRGSPYHKTKKKNGKKHRNNK